MSRASACTRVREGLTEYLEEALPLDERQGLERHLASCPSCRRTLDDLRRTRCALSLLPRQPMPAEMKRHLLQAYRDRSRG